MAKDPAFLFYPNDYIGGTMGMTFEEKGAYIELLMLQFNRGHMTSHMIGQTVGQLWDNIKDKFIIDADGLYYNVRLEQEKENRKAFSNSRRNNLSGTNQYSNKDKKQLGHMTSHMEDVNEDIFNFKNSMIKYGFNENLIYEWLKVRKNKKATNTETAFKKFIAQVELTKKDKNLILEKCIEKSWSGFNSEWIIKEFDLNKRQTSNNDTGLL
jgi:uncharacterized protein YdaU (DUF1376 family)